MLLPLANILHHKLRSVLCAFGIGIAVCMLLALSGLARGTLYEVAERWEQVDADWIAYPQFLGEDVTGMAGPVIPDAIAGALRAADGGRLVQRVTPVFMRRMDFAGQPQTVVGVDTEALPTLLGGREIARGRPFDPDGRCAAWLEEQLLAPATDAAEPLVISERDLASRGGLEIVIDSRLAAAGGYELGQTVESADHTWTIVGIVPAGGMARVFLPRRTAQFLLGDGTITKSTALFVKLRPEASARQAVGRLRAAAGPGVGFLEVAQYRRELERRFGILFQYVDAVNAIALVIAFLFVMLTLYTMVLQRTREIAILKSSGASNGFILRQIIAESLLLTGVGAAVGIALGYLAAWGIQTAKPLYTVTITPRWIGIAVAAAAGGAVAAALYPAWRACRVDLLEALTLE